MRLSLRSTIILNFVVIIVIMALFGGILGAFLINRTTVDEEQRRVSVDLKSAWSVLEGKFSELTVLVNVLGSGKRVAGAFQQPIDVSSRVSLEEVRRNFNLDFLTLTNRDGRVIMRATAPYQVGDDLSNDVVIQEALKGKMVQGFQIFSAERLQVEGYDLPERAFTVFEPTTKAKARAKASEDAGLVMVVASPIQDKTGDEFGVIYAGFLLNRNNGLVDQIRSAVFEGEELDGRPVGTVTIFQWDVRVATNVVMPNGNRALGTRVSTEVYDRVLENDRSWYSRAFVVNDWYISAYDPIHDVEGKVIGILYVGVLAAKYDHIKRELWRIYGGLAVFSALLVVLVGLTFSGRITRTVGRLAEATQRIAAGQYDLRVPEPRTDNELKDLTKAFNSMAASLYDREERLKAAQEDLHRTNTALQTLNTNYLEMLGFISHELKNTLGVIFTSARTLATGLAGELNENQLVLVKGIVRNIDNAVSMTKQYLDMTRLEKGELNVVKQPLDLVTEVIDSVVGDLSEFLAQKNMRLQRDLPRHLPLSGDVQLLRVVFKNLLDNAVKYGREGGLIRLGFTGESGAYRFEVWNEGQGQPPEKVDRLFGKFVRFKMGRESDRTSIGLGLYIVKDIVNKHGGNIWAESKEGYWMRFVFTLPVEPVQGEVTS
jgi:two-component system NtrC family sensor kinase